MTRDAPVHPQIKNQLHGITLEAMVNELVAFFGWEELGQRIPIRCFNADPSVPSSLKFLRKTPWARAKVEGLFLFVQRERARRLRRAGSEVDPVDGVDEVDEVDEGANVVEGGAGDSETTTPVDTADEGTGPERG